MLASSFVVVMVCSTGAVCCLEELIILFHRKSIAVATGVWAKM